MRSTTSTGNVHRATNFLTGKQEREYLKNQSTIGKLLERLAQVEESIKRYERILRNTREYAELLREQISKKESSTTNKTTARKHGVSL